MPKILIIYDSKTGNTEKAAMKVSEGVSETKAVGCVVKRVEETSLGDMLEADGIIIGSPTYYGDMSNKIKKLLDESVDIHGKLEGKVGAAFTSSGGAASGAETTILSILKAFLIHGMVIKGDPDRQHYGLAVIEAPGKEEEKLCRRFGRRIAEFVMEIAAKRKLVI